MNINLLKPRQKNIIRSCFLFNGVEEINVYLENDGCSLMTFEKGEHIYTPDNFFRSVGLVLSGEVLVTNEKGRKLIVNTITQGKPFGVASVFSENEEYETTLKATAKCTVLFFSQELLSEMIKQPVIAENYIRFLTGRIHFLNDKIRSLSCTDAEQALAGYLLANEADGVCLTGQLSTLAEKLGMGRASLYRAFDLLTKNGLIQRDGKTVTIKDKIKLKEISK